MTVDLAGAAGVSFTEAHERGGIGTGISAAEAPPCGLLDLLARAPNAVAQHAQTHLAEATGASCVDLFTGDSTAFHTDRQACEPCEDQFGPTKDVHSLQ